MAGHEAILEWPRAKYERMVDLLNRAFLANCAALYYDTRVSLILIDVFDWTSAGIEESDWTDLGPAVRHFDQLLVFAFEGAPATVIEAWAEDHLEGSGPEALARVRYFREHADAIRAEWDMRALTAGSVLGDIDADVLLSSVSGATPQMLIRLDSFVPGRGPRRAPIASSRQWLTFVASTNDIARLIAQLEFNLRWLNSLGLPDDEASEDIDESTSGPQTDGNPA